jgi:AcrR family transcriptional regulator
MKRSRDTSAVNARILSTADKLFYGEGIRSTGVDTLAAAAGVSKRTLYNHFGSKEALILAYLKGRARPIQLTDAPAKDQILDLFDRLERGFARPDFRGCPFVNAVAELGEHPAREAAKAFKEERRLWFRALAERVGARDPDALSAQLALLLDGAIAQALVHDDPLVARAARDAAKTLIEAQAAPGA